VTEAWTSTCHRPCRTPIRHDTLGPGRRHAHAAQHPGTWWWRPGSSCSCSSRPSNSGWATTW